MTAAAVSLKTPHVSSKMVITESTPDIEIIQEDETEVKTVVMNIQEIPANISGGGTAKDDTDGEKLEVRPDLDSITSQPVTDEEKG